MAVSATMIWELRTVGAMTNGGGFNPSNAASNATDYSQQTNAQYSFTDLASTSGTTNPSVVTSASHSFVTADVGNVIMVSAGTSWTQGWYEIISVSGGAATLDRAVGSAATLSSGTYAVGGALSLNTTRDSAWFGTMQAGNTAWVKFGSFTLGQNVSAFSGGTEAPINVLGYNTTRGDTPTGANRPTINTSAFTLTSGTNVWFKNLMLSGTGTGLISTGASGLIVNCKFNNNATAAGHAALAVGANTFVWNCEIISYRGIGISHSSGAFVQGCYIHDNDTGIKNSANTASSYVDNIIANNVTFAIQVSTGNTGFTLISGNTFYGAENKLGTAISLASGTTLVRALNNVYYGFVTGVTHADTTQTVTYDDYSDYNNNTTDVSGWTKGANDIALNPQFSSVAQLTGSGATSSGSVLTDASANFSTVTPNVDFLYVSAMTGGNGAGKYLITAATTTTLTTDLALGSGTGITYSVTTGHNFLPGANLQNTGFPGQFQASLSSGVMTMGAVQRIPVSTDPGIANVLSTVTYTFQDVSKTGTYVAPTAANVKTGISFGNSQTGTYTGADRWSDPGNSNVLNGVAYKANSTTNNETGTLTSTDPGVSNVVSGTNYEINSVSKTGTYVPQTSTDPGVGNVVSGVNYEINNVNKTGTLVNTDPGPSNVLNGVSYEINSVPLTGTLTSTDPGVSNVTNGTSYEINNVSKTGTYEEPTTGQVKHGVAFGPNGGSTGTYNGSDLWSDPGSNNVSNGVQYLADGVTETGTLDSVTNVLAAATLTGQSLQATLTET